MRSAVPMYLLSRKIKAEGFKVVLSGEGADEVYGGYLFFHKAPSPRHFHECAPQAGTRKQSSRCPPAVQRLPCAAAPLVHANTLCPV